MQLPVWEGRLLFASILERQAPLTVAEAFFGQQLSYSRGVQPCSWRSTFLQSSAPTLIKHN